MDRERSVIAGPKFFQTFTTIAVQRLIVPDALAEEQSPDTIDMQNPLGDQRFALSAKAAAILFLGRRHPDHRANAWFPPLVSHQGADQRLTIDAFSLHTALPTGPGYGPGTHDLPLDPVFWVQHAVDPDPVQPRLLDHH